MVSSSENALPVSTFRRATQHLVRIAALVLFAICFAAATPIVFAQCPTTFSNASPANAATGVATAGTLSWSTDVAADYFTVYFGPQGSGCQNKFLSTSYGGKTFTIDYDNLAPGTTYEWRVEAVKNGCATVSSSCMRFTTNACSSQNATLINPQVDAGMADHLKVAFAWDPVYGATGYNVWYTTDTAGGTNFGSPVKAGSTTGRDSTLLFAIVPRGNHQWWVETLFPTPCGSTISDKWTFGTSCPTVPPQTQTPAAGATIGSAGDVVFTWGGVSGADGYQVWVSRNGATAAMVGSTAETDASLAATSITANLNGPGTYTWYVVATSSSCPSTQSGNATFTVTNNCPSIPVAVSPNSTTSDLDGNVTFTWTAPPNPVDMVVRYTVSITGMPGASPGSAVIVANDVVGTTATATLPPGTYTWRVTGRSADGCSSTSAPQQFTVTGPPVCSNVAPALAAPAQSATVTSPVTLSWQGVQGASGYNVTVWSTLGAQGTRTITTTGTNAQVLVDAGAIYAWQVEARFAGCAATTSAQGNFTVSAVTACPTAAPVIAPIGTNNTLTRRIGDGPITFGWSSVPNATGYTITIRYGDQNGGQTFTSVLDASTLTYSDPHFDPQGGQIEWYVTANYGNSCPAVASAHQTFNVAEPPPCQVSKPLLVGPADKTKTTNLSVTFEWTAVSNAAAYNVYDVAPGESSPRFLGSTQGTSLSTTLSGFGTHSWYVQASGVAGCNAAQSATASITIDKAPVCPTSKVQLVTPANNSTGASNPVQFIWNPVSGATGYQLWASVAGGAPSALTEVLDASTTTATVKLANGEVQWFVKAFFPGCDPTASDPFKVTVATCPDSPRPAQLVLPREGETRVTSPVSFSWTKVAGATSYDLFVGVDGQTPSSVATVVVRSGSTDDNYTTSTVADGAVEWYVRAYVANCSPVDSAHGHFRVATPSACLKPDPPTTSLQPNIEGGQQYWLNFSAPGASRYDIEESEEPTFAHPTSQTLSRVDASFFHDPLADTTWYYRVRARSSCDSSVSDWSRTASIEVRRRNTGSRNYVLSPNTTQLSLPLHLNNLLPSTSYSAWTDQSSMMLLSSILNTDMEGEGTAFLQSLSGALSIGTKRLNIFLIQNSSTSAGHASVSGTADVTIPVSVSLVAPITPTGKGAASASALVIPAVASTPGVNNAFFQSDVRLSNVGAEAQRYNLYFTPSGVNGTRNATQTTVAVEAGQTIALDDILQTWYGVSNSSGVLEIRQVAAGTTDTFANVHSTVASSRTYTNTPGGTYGQYVPAVPFSSFVGKGETLTLLHLAQSSTYRTNLGLVEAAGEPATVHVTAYNALGQAVGSTDLNLQPGEQHQYNGILTTLNAASDNARIDLQVTSATGKVMGYASVIDNRTNDPMLVMPVQPSQLVDNEVVIPGVADLDGIARWRSDIRVYNAGNAPVSVTMTFYPSTDPAQSKSITQTINAGETKQLNDILRTSFNLTNSGGVLHVTTPAGSRIAASGRTYADTGNGTYGQFIPGVPHNSGITKDSAPLQILQLEESPNYRSNLGIIELTGKPVTVQITGIDGDRKTATVTQDLKAYQSVQLGSIFRSLSASESVYNGRISVKVISGSGSVTAYGSVIDNRTQDPTYIPAQQ